MNFISKKLGFNYQQHDLLLSVLTNNIDVFGIVWQPEMTFSQQMVFYTL
jgi:hypothetical protein